MEPARHARALHSLPATSYVSLMNDTRRQTLEERAPAGAVVLESNVGPLLFADNSPFVRGLSRSPVHDPGVVHFMRAHRDRLFPFFDVGANVGLFSIIAAQMASPGDRIVAFEPDQKNLDYLAINLDVYGVDTVEVWPVGIAAQDGPIQLGEINCGRSIHSKAGAISFPGRSILSVSKELDLLPAFIKIDIEGGEADALSGAYDPVLAQTILELEYCPRDHRGRLGELIEHRPPSHYVWEFVLSAADAEAIPLPSQPPLLEGATPLKLVRAETDAQLRQVLEALDEFIKVRASRKWELCISPKRTR
jgi:FkbM family methyltransferase